MTDSALETADQSLHTDYKGRSRFPTRRWDNKSITRAGARNRLSRAQAGGDTHNWRQTMWSDPAFHKMDLHISKFFKLGAPNGSQNPNNVHRNSNSVITSKTISGQQFLLIEAEQP